MSSAISAAAASRGFLSLLRHVRQGRTYIITAQGKPIARIVPVRGGARATGTARAVRAARAALHR